MTILQEIMQLSKSITFDLDIEGNVDDAVILAKKHGATNIQKFDTNAKDKGIELTVKNKTIGNNVINAIYGEEDEVRNSNNFYMGL